MSPTEQARGDSGKEPKLPLRQNGEKKTLGETRLSRGASSPLARILLFIYCLLIESNFTYQVESLMEKKWLLIGFDWWPTAVRLNNIIYHGRRKQNKCGWVLPQKKKLLEYMPFSVVWCLFINGIGRLIGMCYLHYLCPLTSQHYKRRLFKHNSSGAAGKGIVFLKRATRVRVRLLPKSFFSLFTSHITSERHLLSIKNKNEGNNRKV